MCAYTQFHPNTDSYLRIHQIIGCPKRRIQPRIPISKSSWYAGVKSGKFPAGRLLGPRTRVWLESDIARVISEGAL